MKLCDFEVGIEHPLFIIAGSTAARSRGPSGDATAEVLVRGPNR
jgi:hypothetical protein